ncbi:MAG: hypothetical protein ACOC4L_02970 [Halanaerobium sp.]
MVDQIYYKVQYPLKKAIDLMKELDNHELESLKNNLNDHDKEKLISFIENWKNGGRDKLLSLINDLRAQQ